MAHRNGNHRFGRPLGPAGFRRRRERGRAPHFLLLLGSVVGLILTLVSAVTVLAAFQAGGTVYSIFSADLPPVSSIESRQTFKTVSIYDRHGTLLWEFWEPSAGLRTTVALSEVSQNMIDASLAAEDANFYSNPGIEPAGIARAFFQNVSAQGVVSGASTITQQVVRNVLIPEQKYEQSITRKVKEALLAYRLTQNYPKDHILEIYLNEIYYGNMAYGVEAASQTYFAKHVRDLSLAEAAMIAGLPQSPSIYDPYRNPQAALERRSYVLDQMARHGFISERQAELAKREPLNLSAQQVEMKAPHWVNYIRDQLEQRYGPDVVYKSGLKVFTTLDLGLQEELEQVALNNRDYLASKDGNNTALTAINPRTGEILAMVGSMDYWDPEIDGQVNVLLSERQPGSSIKPLVYLLSFLKGFNPSTILMDVRTCWTNISGSSWCPVNFDLTFRGPVPIRIALGNSMNIPAVKALEFIGVDSVKDFASRVGITNWDNKKNVGLSLTLGGAEVRPLELAGFYATLANNGLRIPTVGISRIVDAKGNVLEDYQVPPGIQVVDPRAAYMITDVLADPGAKLITYGTNSLVVPPRPAAVKTGTTDSYRDTWTMGYTPSLVIGVWVGNSDGHPMQRATSTLTAGKVWREAFDVSMAYLGLPPEPFIRPDGLRDAEVCGNPLLRPGAKACYKEIFMTENAPKVPRIYLQGGEPTPTPTSEILAPANGTVLPGATGQPLTPGQSAPQPKPAAKPTQQGQTTVRGTPTPTATPGTPIVQLPMVLGMKGDEAAAQLRRLGLTVRTRVVDSPAPQGIVVDQSPLGGTAVPGGATVTLSLSAGG